jgi:small nuclear ribonucleoprotein (snRNP)-like protein
MKKAITVICIALLGAAAVHADVIRLKSGRILIGKVVSLDAGKVNIEAFGEKVQVPATEIVRTEKTMDALKDQAVEITLKDKTVIQGKVKNYDDDIGFLIEIDFGTITVPLENVIAIKDTQQERNYVAHFTQLGVVGGAYFTVGDLSSTFGNNFTASVFQEFNLGFVFEGLFAGYVISYQNLYCISSPSYSYLLFNINASAIYRMLFLRRETSFLRNFVPYIGIGFGAAVPVMTYYGTSNAEIDLSFTANLGIDAYLSDDFLIRVNAGWLSILQSTLWFNSLAVTVGVAYSF